MPRDFERRYRYLFGYNEDENYHSTFKDAVTSFMRSEHRSQWRQTLIETTVYSPYLKRWFVDNLQPLRKISFDKIYHYQIRVGDPEYYSFTYPCITDVVRDFARTVWTNNWRTKAILVAYDGIFGDLVFELPLKGFIETMHYNLVRCLDFSALSAYHKKDGIRIDWARDGF
jgi:hypothetical protein